MGDVGEGKTRIARQTPSPRPSPGGRGDGCRRPPISEDQRQLAFPRPLCPRGVSRHNGTVFPLTNTYRYVQYTPVIAGFRPPRQTWGAENVTTTLIRELCTSPPRRVVGFRARRISTTLSLVSDSRTHNRRNQNNGSKVRCKTQKRSAVQNPTLSHARDCEKPSPWPSPGGRGDNC